MTFPGAGASVDYNEAGEPIGWSYDYDAYFDHEHSAADDYDDYGYDDE